MNNPRPPGASSIPVTLLERAEIFRELLTAYCRLKFYVREIKGGYRTGGYRTDRSLSTGDYYYVNVKTKVELGSVCFYFAVACLKKAHIDSLTPTLLLAWNPYEKE
ncbi:13889_t:CDS:2 [Ambispora leptoticha]|uniref:13889_t:CDS:1 n=1 Tax=Ambispora leptoticha TaxID=144679 RepID=A0A9N8VMM4_9GLOM|nr:13889_t:CDS:2 [Ambispora leptoticha]